MRNVRWRGSLIIATVLALGVLAGACQATPPPAEKPAASTSAAPLFLMVDQVWGSKNLTDAMKATSSCILNSRWPRNSEIVWRARVFDPKAGEVMDNTVLSKVEIRLANGTNVEMKFGPHPPKSDIQEAYWTGSWVVPKNHPTGILNFTVVATAKDGRSGEYKPMPVASSLPTILEQTLADVPTATPAAKPKP